jgi:ATPase family associated with various cellular activities (AAA)
MSDSAQDRDALPLWAQKIIALYESRAVNQFILHGNVDDRVYLPLGGSASLGSIRDFLLQVLLPQFDLILSYDLGNGMRVEKGAEIFSRWTGAAELPELPRQPRQAIEFLTRYFRYLANLARLGKPSQQVACYVPACHLIAPALPGALNYDVNALALLFRDWATDDLLGQHSLVTCLFTDSLNDLHPLIARNPRAGTIQITQPSAREIQAILALIEPDYPKALREFKGNLSILADQLVGASVNSIEELLRLKEYANVAIQLDDLVLLKKSLVEKDCDNLIEFIESNRKLDDLHGHDKLKDWLRQDVVLWRESRLQALPMGYLICGPVGAGKTFLVECLAGDAGIPVVNIKNFRDKWVGSTEGNLEKIFRLLHALGRCFVFIDEADQTLGKRDSGASDAGLSGRIYSMIAREMSVGENRGKIIWVLASSRPDLIEADLKRPGRIDVKIPVFPAATRAEGFELLRVLCRRNSVPIDEEDFRPIEKLVPEWLTPGAAESLAVKTLRTVLTGKVRPGEALRRCLLDYRPPVSRDVMEAQIRLAVNEASDWAFVPPEFRNYREG